MTPPNDSHLQIGFFDIVERLPEKVRQRLEESWVGTFYREILCRGVQLSAPSQ